MNQNIKKQTTWKNNYFARYMLLRYSLALFFFANMYWFLVLLYQKHFFATLPLILIVSHTLGSVEQFKLYGKREAVLHVTKKAFQMQFIICLAVIGICLTPFFADLFSVFADNALGRSFVIVLQMLGLGVVNLNLSRITQILDNKDKFYLRFQSKIEKYI